MSEMYFYVALSRVDCAIASLDRISWARLRERTRVEGELRSYPRAKNITYTRATSALQVDQRSGNRDRPAARSLLSFPSPPVVAPYSITTDGGLRNGDGDGSIAMSSC